MKRKLIGLFVILAVCIVLSGCEEKEVEIAETENVETAETVEPDYSDVDVIRGLYEEQGYTVIDILDPRCEEVTYNLETSEFEYALKGDCVVVRYYPNEKYFVQIDWFNVNTGEAVTAPYTYDREEETFASIDFLDTQTLRLLKDGTFGQLVTLKYDGSEATCTVQDNFRKFTSERLCWKLISPRYCAYLHDAQLEYDLIENSVRFGFTGRGEFDVPVPQMPPMLILFGYDEACQYLENALPEDKFTSVKDKLTDGDNMVYIIMYNTLIEDGFALPAEDKEAGVFVTNAICVEKDTLVEISLRDEELSCYTMRWVWTESDNVPGLHLIFDDDGTLDVSEEKLNEMFSKIYEVDGAFAEDLSIELAEAFISNPELFVTELAKRTDDEISTVASLVTYNRSYFDLQEHRENVESLFSKLSDGGRNDEVLNAMLWSITDFCRRMTPDEKVWDSEYSSAFAYEAEESQPGSVTVTVYNDRGRMFNFTLPEAVLSLTEVRFTDEAAVEIVGHVSPNADAYCSFSLESGDAVSEYYG